MVYGSSSRDLSHAKASSMPISMIEKYRKWSTRKVDRAHVETLLQHKRNTEQEFFDPITVWRDEDGCIFVIDGMHRLTAYIVEGEVRDIPVILMAGSPQEALLIASSSASRPVRGSNGIERQDIAWMMVRTGYAYTSKEIAYASGVSIRQVKYMRARLRAFLEAQVEPTGEWWRDRSDDMSHDTTNGGFSSMSQAEAARAVKSGIRSLKDFIRDQGEENLAFKSDEGITRLLVGALGDERVKRIFCDYFNRDYISENLGVLPDPTDAFDRGSAHSVLFE